ncbi:apses-domain-containing protein [Trichodelitschia bisporula]|uniref:Transcription factor SWI6 n=1 Tax=Trichodelitschia bisporula TaxID=703511 RepID=A0A6G1I191_9PEZI|nr:apses-domain-containing protein [Trichodelitschia bisporula]
MNYRYDVNGQVPHPMSQSPQIYTALYSGVSVYEMEVNGIAVMRRRSDSWLNATQILKVAGVDKGKRTKVLEKEILTGEHEKVQGGYGKYQGTWINYRRGREFCRQYGVEEILRPLLDYDMSADGSGQPGHGVDTPTKEQAMAANRKRFYTQTLDGRPNQGSAGTFFSNISSTASNALAAMNKAARLNSPAPRPSSAQRRMPGPPRSSQQSLMGTQESFQSMTSMASERSFGGASDAGYAVSGLVDEAAEPPRKRLRQGSPGGSFSQVNGMDGRDGTPTEAADSFIYHQAAHYQHLATADGEVPSALPPLPHPGDKRTEEKQALILDLFSDIARTDYSTHAAILQLSGAELDIPLDQSANTALHWAATLARVPLMRLLISKGASIFRGNIAGETPLMSAVTVNNNLDHSCFPELLEILAPLIEVRDAKGRTILHHIAVACGIKGRAASSKYYLEALLEFLVRSNSAPSSQIAGGAGSDSAMAKPIGLMRFMSEMVNARDMAGNTALNLVARIGNRSIIQQLLEVQADPNIPNYKGLRPVDFGVGGEAENEGNRGAVHVDSPGRQRTASKVEETSREMVPSLTSSLTETHSQFSAEMRLIQDRIDGHTHQIRELSAQQKALSQQVEKLQSQLRRRSERKQKLANLRRAIGEMSERARPSPGPPLRIGDADAEFAAPEEGAQNPAQLQAWVFGYNALNSRLAAHLTTLRARDSELEGKYRKVIALCTGVPEEHVDGVIWQLVLAVESEGEHDVGRVREFLRRVEGVV